MSRLNDWIFKLWYTYVVEYYATLKGTEKSTLTWKKQDSEQCAYYAMFHLEKGEMRTHTC